MRFTWGGKPNEMGLGGAAVSLAQARDKADAARKLVAAGVNPIEYRRMAKHLRAGKSTFGQCADELLAAKASEWRNEKHKAQWRMTLTEYAKPLRALSVDEVDTEAVLSVLQPMWQSIPETASRLRARIEAVLDAAQPKDTLPATKRTRLGGVVTSTNSCRSARSLRAAIMLRWRSMTCRISSANCASGTQWRRWPWSSQS